MAALNVRVDSETATFLEAMARQTGCTKSQLVREALESLRRDAAGRAAVAPADAMARLIGCWDSGGMQLSERTGERFAKLLAEKRRGHRTGRRRTAGRAH